MVNLSEGLIPNRGMGLNSDTTCISKMSRGTILDFLKFIILTPFLVKNSLFKDHFDDKIKCTNRMRVIFIRSFSQCVFVDTVAFFLFLKK